MLIYCLLIMTAAAHAQSSDQSPGIASITIAECYHASRENYPLIKQLDLIDKTTHYSLSNASHGNLPQVSLSGQATYQSAVTELPLAIPGMEIPTVDKDQYKIYGEVYQPLTNFSNVNATKNI